MNVLKREELGCNTLGSPDPGFGRKVHNISLQVTKSSTPNLLKHRVEKRPGYAKMENPKSDMGRLKDPPAVTLAISKRRD